MGELDRAVAKSYGEIVFAMEAERVADLMERHQKSTAGVDK